MVTCASVPVATWSVRSLAVAGRCQLALESLSFVEGSVQTDGQTRPTGSVFPVQTVRKSQTPPSTSPSDDDIVAKKVRRMGRNELKLCIKLSSFQPSGQPSKERAVGSCCIKERDRRPSHTAPRRRREGQPKVSRLLER